VQLSQANANNASATLTQAQAQGALIGNQQAQTQLDLLRKGISNLSNFSGQSPPPAPVARDADPDDKSAFVDDAGLDVGLRDAFWVNPMGTPQQQQGIVMAHLSGNAGLASAATAQRDMSVGQQVAVAQKQSSDLFDKMMAVQNAPPGQTMAAFEATMPQGAKIVQAEIDEGVDPDEAARDMRVPFLSRQCFTRSLRSAADSLRLSFEVGLSRMLLISGLLAAENPPVFTW
jgi:hypothetical protein